MQQNSLELQMSQNGRVEIGYNKARPLCGFIFFLITLLLISTFAHAQSTPAKPLCPNPELIKTIKFDTVLKGDTSGVWTLIQDNQDYQTGQQWKFSMIVEAESEKEALNKANAAVLSLKKTSGPQKVDTAWVCDYKSKYALSAVAVSGLSQNK